MLTIYLRFLLFYFWVNSRISVSIFIFFINSHGYCVRMGISFSFFLFSFFPFQKKMRIFLPFEGDHDSRPMNVRILASCVISPTFFFLFVGCNIYDVISI